MNPEKDATAVPQEQEAPLTKYELMMIFVPDMSQEETDKELEKVRKELKKQKAEIYHEDIWDVRTLAYEIKKHDKGYYAIFYFTLDDPSKLSDMEKDFVLNLKMLRHMLLKSPKNYEFKKLEDLMAKSEIKQGPPPKEAVAKAKEAPKKEAPKVEEKPKEESKEEPKEEKKEEEKAPEPEVVEEKKEEEKPMDISDLDSKLESILDDPDIDIKL